MQYVQLVAQLDPQAWARALLAFALCALILPLTFRPARRWGWVDRPGGRKLHEGAIPVTGGLAILLAMAAVFLLFEPRADLRLIVFVLLAAGLVVVGQADDLHDLRWPWRLGAQAAVAVAMYGVAGLQASNLQDVFGFAGANIGLFSLPFTVFIVVGVINALNMADGVDGLAGTLSLVSLALFTAFALYSGDLLQAERLLALSAAVAGFLLWNLRFPWQPRAKAFLGNGGSMLLGFLIAWTAVRLTQNPGHPVSPVLGPWTLALPLIDCVVLMFRRVRQGRSPFRADRHHMHHLLLEAGFRPGQVVLLLAGISLALGIGAAVALKLGIYRPLLVLAFLALIAGWYAFTCNWARAVARLARWRGGGPVGAAA